MTEVVVDASAALSWLLASQSTPASKRFIAELEGRRLSAPFVFGWEVNNTLLASLRRGRLSAPAYEDACEVLRRYDVKLGAPFHATRMFALAQEEHLSLFDAAYLDHALQARAELASRDRELLSAAVRRGVVIHDLAPELPA